MSKRSLVQWSSFPQGEMSHYSLALQMRVATSDRTNFIALSWWAILPSPSLLQPIRKNIHTSSGFHLLRCPFNSLTCSRPYLVCYRFLHKVFGCKLYTILCLYIVSVVKALWAGQGMYSRYLLFMSHFSACLSSMDCYTRPKLRTEWASLWTVSFLTSLDPLPKWGVRPLIYWNNEEDFN